MGWKGIMAINGKRTRRATVAGPTGSGKPWLNKHLISFNGKRLDDYESFVLGNEPPTSFSDWRDAHAMTGFVKTEYRPYDAVVVSQSRRRAESRP